jgi:hypothetical protein
MDAKDRRYLQHLLEADDGTFVDGDDVALNRDPRDPRINNLAASLRELQVKLRAAYRAAHQFRKISEILVLLPEEDPRRLDGMMAEIDTDVDVITQACERLQPRLTEALEVLGVEA